MEYDAGLLPCVNPKNLAMRWGIDGALTRCIHVSVRFMLHAQLRSARHCKLRLVPSTAIRAARNTTQPPGEFFQDRPSTPTGDSHSHKKLF